MEYSKIFSEISNPIRIKLLLILNEKKSTISELKDEIGDISHSEISRHVGRLAKHDLITKESIPGRKYELTHFGRILVKLFGPLEFFLSKSEYFKNHKIDDIPESLLHGIENLKTSELILGTGSLLSKGKDLLELANEKLFVMTNDLFTFEIAAKEVDLIIPPKMLKYGLKVDHEKTKYNVHTLPEVHLCIIISDIGQGFIFFPNLESSSPDFNSGFYSIESEAIDYLKRVFNYFWQNSKEFIFDPRSL